MLSLLCCLLAAAAPTPAEEVESVFQRAIRERAAINIRIGKGASPRRSRVTGWSLRLVDGSAGASSTKSLPQARSLEEFAGDLREMETAKAKPYLQEAAERLEGSDPRQRALAIEVLALVPEKTVDLGLLPKLAERLDDRAVAFRGWSIDVEYRQAAIPGDSRPKREPAAMTVGEVAQAGLLTVLPVRFRHNVQFQRWWERGGHDFRSSLWYWALHWRHAAPSTLTSEGLAADATVRIALLVDVPEARIAEIRQVLPPEEAERLEKAHYSVPSYRHGRRPPPEVIAKAVKLLRLKGTLLSAVSGDLNESVPTTDWIRETFTERALAVLPYVLTADDAPELDRLLRRQEGTLAKSRERRIQAVQLLMKLLPKDRVVGLLLRELRDRPGLHELTAELIDRNGFEHWPVIKRSYETEGRERAVIIDAVAGRGRSARGRLGELLAADDLVPAPAGDNSIHVYHRPQSRFVAFVEAANRLSGEGLVVSKELRDRSLVRIGKGMPPELKAHNAAVPKHRTRAVAKLKDFFTP